MFKRQLFLLCLFIVFTPFPVAGQEQTQTEADVIKSAVLHSDPNSSSKRVGRLAPPDRVVIVDPTPTNGYYHIQTTDGDDGWVWGQALQIRTAEQLSGGTSTPTTTGGVTTSGAPADSIAPDWEKPTANKVTFKGKEGNCPWNGNGSDPDQFGLKNRTDVPTTYHDVNWSAVGKPTNLPFPKAPMHRKDWTDAQLAQIKPYEGVAIRVIGYVVAIKPQNGGGGEGTNCKFNQVGDVDTHIALVEKAGDAEHDSAVIEFTPRFLKAHPNWTKAKLSPWLDSDNPVRVSGWLMLDPDHRAHLGKFRQTLWEIHPITKFEVFKNGKFVDLDSLP